MGTMTKINIYRLTFQNGKEYVGQTKGSVRARISGHKTDPSNNELSNLLQKEEPIYVILSSHTTKHRADEAEKKAIRALIMPINRMHVANLKPSGNPPFGGEKMFVRRHDYAKRNKTPTNKATICSQCKKKKPATAFYPDRSRHNGLCSRCIKCDSIKKQRTDKPAVCSWCKVKQPAREFHSDSSRPNGLCSRCRSCDIIKRAETKKAHRTGKDVGKAYNDVKKLLTNKIDDGAHHYEKNNP